MMGVFRKIFSWMLTIALLLGLLPMAVVNAASNDSGTIYLQMNDSYGDGWNDNKIALYIDGVFSANYTFTGGYSASVYISYDPAQSYEFKWVKGRYSSECSFTLSKDGVTLLNASTSMCSGYTDGQVLYSMEGSADYDLEGEFAGGSGTAADPYLVATKAQLDNVRDYPYDHFLQVRDIAFTASDFAAGGDFYNDGKGWVPICHGENDIFYGTYDGDGHVISGLTIKQCGTYMGLFGQSIGSVVNVNMTGLSYTATGSAFAGGIVGYGIYNQGEIIGCTASGTITVKQGYVGGIVGDGGTVKHCTSNVAITVSESSYDNVGGIAGYANWIFGCENNGNILVQGGQADVGGIVGAVGYNSVSDCKNTGSVTAETTEDSATINAGGIAGFSQTTITRCENIGAVIGSGYYAEVGGIVGEFYRYNDSSVCISQCVNAGTVSATASSGTNLSKYSDVGGICGRFAYSTIEDCYVTGTVTLTNRGTQNAYAGGIVGMADSGTVTNCYSVVSSVNVNTSAGGWGRGGIAGYNAGTIDNCYYYYSYGVGYNNGTALVSRVSTLSNFAKQSTYYEFDFTSTWKMGTGTYTYAVLRMESGHAHTLISKAATVTHETSGKLAHWYCDSCDTYFRNASGTRYTTSDALESDPLPRTGTCGTNVNWVMTNEGVLTISGTGKMADYQSGGAPWYGVRDKVKQIIVEDGVTGIGSYAFEGCSAVSQLVLPEDVTTVGDGAFSQITKLVIAFTGNAPTFGGSNVFSGTTASAHYPANNTTWKSDLQQSYGGTVTWNSFQSLDQVIVASGTLSSSISWKVSLTGILRVSGSYTCSMNNYTYSSRPAWEDYKDRITSLVLRNIDHVGNYAFYKYTALEKVDLGCAKSIGQYAFYDCDALKRAFIEYGYTTCTIGSNAFYHCSSLEEVAFSSKTTIGTDAFGYCEKLKDIYIISCGGFPYSYNPIGEYQLKPSADSFDKVTATVHLPGGWSIPSGTSYNYGGTLTWVRSDDFGPCGPDAYWNYDAATATVTISGTGRIGYYTSGSVCPWYAFYTEAKHLVIEDGITAIPEYTFEYMEKIETAKLPDTLQTLCCNAFNNCRSLNNLLLPASLTYLSGYGYFNRCDALTDVYYMGTTEDWTKVENYSVIGSSYDNVERVHCLQLSDGSATCTTPGAQPHYRFDDTSVYSGMYDDQYQLIVNPETTPALGHDYTAVVTAPTCTEDGYTTYTCQRCEHTYQDDSVSALGHTWQAATCTDPQICTTCQITQGEALGHTWQETTCTSPQICTTCQITQGEALGHTWQDATCTTPQTCATCQITQGEALGHTWQDATCTTPQTCATCQITQGEALGHDWQEATCTTPQTCTVCQSTHGDPLGHSGDIWIEITAPSCAKSGMKARICEICGSTETITVPALGHSYEAVVTAPTCTQQGYTTYTCSVCQNSYTDDYMEAKGHKWSAWIQTEPSTCVTEGSQTRFCNCGELETQPVAKLDHSYINGMCDSCGVLESSNWKLVADAAATLTLTEDMYIDLNGYSLTGTIITNGYKIYGLDSATNEYTCDSMGYFSCVDETGNAIVPESLYTTEDTVRYMTIETENGYTFHRYYLGITNITLAPAVTGFGYKAEFYGDEMVQGRIESIGYNLWVTEEIVISRTTDFKNTLTLRLKNFDVANYGDTPVNACVRITLVDGTVITGETHSNTMKQVVESVNTNYESLTEAQMAAVNTMIASTPTMQTWQIENLYKKES